MTSSDIFNVLVVIINVIILLLLLLLLFVVFKSKSHQHKPNLNMKGGNVDCEYSKFLPSSLNSFDYLIERTNGKPLYISLRSEPLTDWKKIKKYNIQTKVLVDSPAYFFEHSMRWVYVPIERIGNIAWNLVKGIMSIDRDIPVWGPRERPFTKSEIENKIKKYGEIPNNIHIISTNHRHRINILFMLISI